MLTASGRRLPTKAVRALGLCTAYVEIGWWMDQQGFDTSHRVQGRKAVFDEMIGRAGARSVTYLEFGVFEGASIRHFSAGLKGADTQLHGFDSFEGLPETFDSYTYERGRFDVGGQVPAIDDPRVKFHVGWFDDTVPRFEVPELDVLMVNFDADLYSSTMLVLNHIEKWVVPGTMFYFDEMSRVDHEPAAFKDFMDRTGKRFKVLAVDHSLNTCAFECVA